MFALNVSSSKTSDGWPAASISWSTVRVAVPKWQPRQISAALPGSIVSRIPSAIDLAGSHPRSVCWVSHGPAGPWQASQLTPSPGLSFGSPGSFSAWQSRQRSGCLALSSQLAAVAGPWTMPRRRAMRRPRSVSRLSYALACRSLLYQVTYSFWRLLSLSSRGVTLPWQLLEEQAAGPT